MGQEVQLPDGRILEYPIEATREQIEQHAVQWAIDNPLPVVTPVLEPVVEPSLPEYRGFLKGLRQLLERELRALAKPLGMLLLHSEVKRHFRKLKLKWKKSGR